MLSLSFKEWPFLTFNKAQPKNPLNSHSLTDGERTMLKSNIPINLVLSKDFLNMKIMQQMSVGLLDDDLSDNKAQINTIQKNDHIFHLSSLGRCGLFACTNESCLSILSNDSNNCLTPIFMFSPFEKFTVGKISEEPSKNTLITAIGWANGYLKPAIPKPIIAISSSKGHVLIYDISSRSIIGNIHFNDQIISILWSAFNPNLFYCGSNSGHLYICEYIDRKSIQIRKILHFIANSNESKENALKSIDFITQDDVDGFTLAIASKDGSIGYVTNLNEPENAKLQVFQNIDFLVPNKDSNFNVNFFEFYPNNTDFVTIATNQSTYLISLSKGILIPFIPMKNCRFISLINKEQDKVIVGDDNDIVVWKLVNQSLVRSNILKICSKFDFT